MKIGTDYPYIIAYANRINLKCILLLEYIWSVYTLHSTLYLYVCMFASVETIDLVIDLKK